MTYSALNLFELFSQHNLGPIHIIYSNSSSSVHAHKCWLPDLIKKVTGISEKSIISIFIPSVDILRQPSESLIDFKERVAEDLQTRIETENINYEDVRLINTPSHIFPLHKDLICQIFGKKLTITYLGETNPVELLRMRLDGSLKSVFIAGVPAPVIFDRNNTDEISFEIEDL
ncbi:hypothetical protein COW46_01425 [Candidatus Gracilibacteria bacterium CG17_big_fil_post_rev_8_21_14_2_50_48_13]|nr:MAG: hypothetical protein COW46_01425 [Candidatus Gracilibacteria bacterium CG17_big_fil_post_rev_8_21_14_2_50_48_13]